MSLRIGQKFSNKFLKNIEKSYKTVTNEEDIYYTFSPHNNNNNMEDVTATTAQ
ncbi:hypothetical protein RhiirA5_445891 [Rhizophagus irregularis]|uniref:Uncharacterized protein n=1 Tax=Rhizophagus irregularis TaxID=588596 RepID=A0A2N0NC27_9GLOM|nr:hypothetical protein RhiirA5_445891 [Rhizophagus irregularis]